MPVTPDGIPFRTGFSGTPDPMASGPDARARASAVASRLWPTAPLVIEPLSGGITNENFKVGADGQVYVIRVFGQGAEMLLIDRVAEREITAIAAGIGVGPELVAAPPDTGTLVTRFIDGQPVTAAQMRDRDVLRRATDTLRRLHTVTRAPKSLDPFRDIDCYSAEALRRGVATHPDFVQGIGLAGEIESLVGYSSVSLCHGDLLSGNFILTPGGVYLVDWEYSGIGDPAFDLANLSVNHQFSPGDDELLLGLYSGHADEVMLARIRVLRLVSVVREAAWSYLQAAISALDVDFIAYADTCLDTMRRARGEPSFRDALDLLRRHPVRRPAT